MNTVEIVFISSWVSLGILGCLIASKHYDPEEPFVTRGDLALSLLVGSIFGYVTFFLGLHYYGKTKGWKKWWNKKVF